MKRRRRSLPFVPPLSAFAGFRFPAEVILLAVRWYLRFGLAYRDLDELLAERGIDVDQVTLFGWVQRFTPLLVDATCTASLTSTARSSTFVSRRRNIAAAPAFFTAAVLSHGEPEEVVTDSAAALAHLIAELIPDALHNTDEYANNQVECDHGRLKARLRPMRGLNTDRTASVIIHGHAFTQTSAEATTNSAPTHDTNSSASRPHSTNSRPRSHLGIAATRRTPLPNATAPHRHINPVTGNGFGHGAGCGPHLPLSASCPFDRRSRGCRVRGIETRRRITCGSIYRGPLLKDSATNTIAWCWVLAEVLLVSLAPAGAYWAQPTLFGVGIVAGWIGIGFVQPRPRWLAWFAGVATIASFAVVIAAG